jgi:acetyltransferase
MPVRNLNKLFYPRSIAVLGATSREGDAGHLVMHNLLQGGFEGPIMPVSAEQRAIAGVLAYPGVEALPMVPDLAVICAPPVAVPEVVRDLGKFGTRAAIVMATGVTRNGMSAAWHEAAAEARPFGMRILGPECMGVIVPHIGLNASFAHVPAMTGGIAFVSQSSAMSMAVLDWARHRDIGFSHFVSLGQAADIDFDDVLDFLGSDAMTRAILLYVENVRNGRTFMSAGRGASRNKPILVIKAGRVKEGQRLAAMRSGAATGADEVYDAAIRRAGMLRVFSFGELFAAVETLARARPLRGNRLAVLANGYGVAIMAADTLVGKDGSLAVLGDETMAKLDAVLPNGCSRSNPVSLATDAPPEVYANAAKVLLQAPEVNALMVLHVPTAMASSTEAAEAVIRVCKETKGNVLTSWMGGETVEPARRRFGEAAIPSYDTPTQAIDAFMHMVRFRRNQEILMETPPSMPHEFTPAAASARRIVAGALADARAHLDVPEMEALLDAYGIPTLEVHFAATPQAAVDVACDIGFPVSLTLLSGDDGQNNEHALAEVLFHKPDAVRSAAEALLSKGREQNPASQSPGSNVQGLLVKRVPLHRSTREVRIEVAIDPIFGPVIAFGEGGVGAHVLEDRAAALPPLNLNLARELIFRTRAARTLAAGGNAPAADVEALCLTLVKVSQMIVDIPEIVAFDICRLLVDADGVLATEVRVQIAAEEMAPERRLAIRPYPKELEEEFVMTSGRKVLLRPIRPEDEPQHYEFLSKITLEDIRYRFFGLVRRLPHSEMARLTQIDYDREMAFIATAPLEDGNGGERSGGENTGRETLGVVRTITDPNNDQAEYAILVRSDLKGQRLGWKLLDKMVHYCRSRGTKEIVGQILRDNSKMLDLVHGMGFRSRGLVDEDVVEVSLKL